ncbi:N-acetyltransferase [Paracoccus caeni]|uniref:N-acetyltransferase n=1 Tax=Paracoccus caeni TaxID=657651 RepID=A0A934S8Z6_9RHOB|nr:N-acetyltransferase [Paracoccus caeni]MBK4214565.1 N-acetyltransferase [Paracoccus caeni]
MHIRLEDTADIDAIRQITEAAFEGAPYSAGTEGRIIDALRAADALTVSLVAEDGGEVIGHVAFSPVTIEGAGCGWYGLGPVAVRPDRHRGGIGQLLIRQGLSRLAILGAKGCVVLGDPGYYGRFGFSHDPGLRYEGAPPEYFTRLVIAGPAPTGAVAFHDGFNVA